MADTAGAVVITTIRVRVVATEGQHRALDRLCAESAGAYNAMLESWKMRYRWWLKHHAKGEPMPAELDSLYRGGHGLSKQITGLRAADPYWGAVSVNVLRGVAQRFDATAQAFYKRKRGYPRFRARARWRTIDVPDVSPSMVKAPADGDKWWSVSVKGVPPVKFADRGGRLAAALAEGGRVKFLRITKTALRAEIHLVVNDAKPSPKPPDTPTRTVGIDPGIKTRLAFCTGETIPKLSPDTGREKYLRRVLSRAERGSGNRRRKRRTLGKETARRTERQRQADHRLAAGIVARFDGIAVEDTPVSNLTRSGGSRKKGLNRNLLNQRIAEVATMIGRKAESAGVLFVRVPARHTTQTCSRCARRQRMALSERVYECGGCGLVLDRDTNAAHNLCQSAFGAPRGGDSHGPEHRAHPPTSGHKASHCEPQHAGDRRRASKPAHGGKHA